VASGSGTLVVKTCGVGSEVGEAAMVALGEAGGGVATEQALASIESRIKKETILEERTYIVMLKTQMRTNLGNIPFLIQTNGRVSR
jgi:hypothetical protein